MLLLALHWWERHLATTMCFIFHRQLFFSFALYGLGTYLVATKSLFSSLSAWRVLGGHHMFFFFIVNENGTWQPSSAFFFFLSIRKILNGHHVFLFSSLLTRMAPNAHLMSFFPLYWWLITPSGHHIPFFPLGNENYTWGAPSAFLFSLLTKNKPSGH